MADDPAGLVSAYYEILQAGAGSYDPQRLRSILVPDLDFDGPIAGHVRGSGPVHTRRRGIHRNPAGHPLPAAGDHARRGCRALRRGPAGRHAAIRRVLPVQRRADRLDQTPLRSGAVYRVRRALSPGPTPPATRLRVAAAADAAAGHLTEALTPGLRSHAEAAPGISAVTTPGSARRASQPITLRDHLGDSGLA